VNCWYISDVRLPGTPRYLTRGYRTRELARVFRSSLRQLGHSVAHERECNVLSFVSIAVNAVVKQVSSV
jgi:hypothetical protein